MSDQLWTYGSIHEFNIRAPHEPYQNMHGNALCIKYIGLSMFKYVNEILIYKIYKDTSIFICIVCVRVREMELKKFPSKKLHMKCHLKPMTTICSIMLFVILIIKEVIRRSCENLYAIIEFAPPLSTTRRQHWIILVVRERGLDV